MKRKCSFKERGIKLGKGEEKYRSRAEEVEDDEVQRQGGYGEKERTLEPVQRTKCVESEREKEKRKNKRGR